MLLFLVSVCRAETLTVRAWQRNCFGGNVFKTETWRRKGALFVSESTGRRVEAALVEQIRLTALGASQDPRSLADEWGWNEARYRDTPHPADQSYEDFRLAAAEIALAPADRSYSGISLTMDDLVLLGQHGLNWTVRQPGENERLVFSKRLSELTAKLVPENVLLQRDLDRDPFQPDSLMPMGTWENWLLLARARQAEELRLSALSDFKIAAVGNSSVTLRAPQGPVELFCVPSDLSPGEIASQYRQACRVLDTLPWLQQWQAQGERKFMVDLITPTITNPKRWNHPSDGWLHLWSDPPDPLRQEYAMIQVQFTKPEFLVYMADGLTGRFARYNTRVDWSLLVEGDQMRRLPFETIDL